MRVTELMSYLPACSSGRAPIQIVGTPAANVTCSSCMRLSTRSGCIEVPGNSWLAPKNVAAVVVAAVVDDYQALDSLEGWLHLAQGGQQRPIDDDEAVFGVVDDVLELVLEQADVERVQDGAEHRHGEVELEVLVMVPAE